MPRSVATVPLSEADEPHDTLVRLISDYGAGAVLRSLRRALMDARKQERCEGELDRARALRRAATSCSTASDDLIENGL